LFQEVELTIWKLEEIQTEAFASFLQKAVESFTKAIDQKEGNPEEAMPWSVQGEKWHKSTKGFKPGRRVFWDRNILTKVLRVIEEATPEASWDWASRDSVKRRFAGIGMSWARLMTKQNKALELNLVGPKGRFNLAAFDRFGVGHQLRTNNPRYDAIRISIQSDDDFSERPFSDFLSEHAEAFRSEFAKMSDLVDEA
jgi:hypothetical protein